MLDGHGEVMKSQNGCGRQLLGAVVLVGLICWGVNSCVRRGDEARRGDEQLHDSLTHDQSTAEGQIKANKAGNAVAGQQSLPSPPGEQNESAIESQGNAAIEAAKWRTWKAANGKYEIKAKFVKMAMGTLTLEKENGTTIDVQFDRLCSEDQDFIRQQKWRIPASGVSGPSAKVVRARVIPYITPNGTRTQMVLVDWRNTGTTTVRAIDADIVPYDASGNRLGSGASDYAIYAESDSSPGIVPGKKYTEPMGNGFILAPGFAEAVRVEINIPEVVESGAY